MTRKMLPCDYCKTPMPAIGYGGPETCPGCGLVWYYDEGLVPEVGSIKAIVVKAVAAERESCAALCKEEADYQLHEYYRDGTEAPRVAEAVVRELFEKIKARG